jgi:hypothetical protein
VVDPVLVALLMAQTAVLVRAVLVQAAPRNKM